MQSGVRLFDREPSLLTATGVAIQALLSQRFPRAVIRSFRQVRSSSQRNLVVRVEIEEDRGITQHLVVKCPRDSGKFSVARINHEAAALQYLSMLTGRELPGLAPKVYAHDPGLGILAIEDLVVSRGARSLHDLLQGEGTRAAEGVNAVSRVLARLHRCTFTRLPNDGGKETPVLARGRLLPELDHSVRIFQQKLKMFGHVLDAGSVEELSEVDMLLHRQGVVSFCHGDVSPDNVFLSQAGVHLTDFEASGSQHPILEGTHLGWLFPLSVDSGSLPTELIEGAKATYRREFELAREIGHIQLDRIEGAAIIAFLLYHWVNTFPEVGVPLGYGGSRTKVLELSRLLDAGQCEKSFPKVTHLLQAMSRNLLGQAALAPNSSLPYACFQDMPAGHTAHGETEESAVGSEEPIGISGVFRVNSNCHLVIKKHDSRNIAVYVLQHPDIHCRANYTCGWFRGVELPLEMRRVSPAKAIIRDRRTNETVEITRQRDPYLLLRHLNQLLRIRRCHIAAALTVSGTGI